MFYFSAHIVHVSIDVKQEKLYRRYDRKHEYRIQVCEDSYKYSDKMCVIRYTQCICKTPANPQIHVWFLCHRHLYLRSKSFFQILKLASNSQIDVLFQILKSAATLFEISCGPMVIFLSGQWKFQNCKSDWLVEYFS